MKNIIFGFLLIFLSASMGFAEINPEEGNLFKIYNPDGEKYAFTKNFLMGLSYLNLNENQRKKTIVNNSQELEEVEKTNALKDMVMIENVNLRIARNLVEDFQLSDNGLIIRSSNLFIDLCNDLIDLNNKEKALLGKLFEAQVNEAMDQFDKEHFFDQQRVFAAHRKDTLKKLLEASILFQRILVSDQPNDSGEFSNLGISTLERQKLLKKMNDLFGQDTSPKLKEGQTFLEGSISSIRAVLEDESWGTTDG